MVIKTRSGEVEIYCISLFRLKSNEYIIYKKDEDILLSQVIQNDREFDFVSPDPKESDSLKVIIKELSKKDTNNIVLSKLKYQSQSQSKFAGKFVNEKQSIKLSMEEKTYEIFVNNPFLNYKYKKDSSCETKDKFMILKIIIGVVGFVLLFFLVIGGYSYIQNGKITFDFWNTHSKTDDNDNKSLEYSDALYCYRRMSPNEELYGDETGERLGIYFDENGKRLNTITLSFFNKKAGYYEGIDECSNLEECQKYISEHKNGCLDEDGEESVYGCKYLTLEEKGDTVIASYYVNVSKNPTFKREFEENCPNCDKSEMKESINISNENKDNDSRWTCK